MESTPIVSVVIAMRNEEAHIGASLQSVVKQDYPCDRLEVLVVDGMSTDRSREIVLELSARHPHIRLLDNPKRIPSAAWNVGIKKARGSMVAVVSAHCHLAPDFISRCVHLLLEEQNVDCVGGPLTNVGETFEAQAIALAMSFPFGVGDSYFRYARRERYVDTIAFAVYRRAVFDRVGLFDETLAVNEDYDLNYRLRKAGGKILLTPQARSFYYTRTTLPRLWSQYFRYGFWKVQMLRKHPRSVRVRQLVPPLFVLTLLLSGALSAISNLAAWVFALVVASYLSLALAFSFSIAARNGWRYLPILPVIFACLHLSWGLGFLYSLARLTFQWPGRR
jgi:succinoglycan biosynthesis protein ExoA